MARQARHGTVSFGQVRLGRVWTGKAGEARRGRVGPGVARPGEVWRGRCGQPWRSGDGKGWERWGQVWLGRVGHGLVRQAWKGPAWHSVEWNGPERLNEKSKE